MSKLQFHNNKVLKLTNVLKYKILLDNENFDLNVAIEQMQFYIRAKGAMQIEPLIQYTRAFLNENNELDVIRVSNALYCRYTGLETSLKFVFR